jgi:hypothetical protein
MKKYISGTRIRSVAFFENIDGVPTSPSDVEFKYRAGAGETFTDINPSNPVEGEFYSDIDTSGWVGPDDILYTCQWKGTGLVEAVGLDYFEIEPPAL